MKIIDEKRIANNFVVLTTIKSVLITRLQKIYYMYIWALENNSFDLNILGKANRIIVVIDEKQIKNKVINAILINVINFDNFRACQIVLLNHVSSGLNIIKLFLIKFIKLKFVKFFLFNRDTYNDLQIFCVANQNETKLLAMSMRDATIINSNLRKTHCRVE